MTHEHSNENLKNLWNIRGLDRQLDVVVKYQKEESELRKLIDENKSNIDWLKAKDSKDWLKTKLDETIVQETELKKNRALEELKQDHINSEKFSDEICKETDDKKILDLINGEDIHKSMLFNFDDLWSRFETFDGVTKLVCLFMFSDYIIILCVFSIIINLYGSYLIDRFNLEIRYPRVAVFIKYRQKLSKYYVLSNLIYILITCVIGLVLSFSILDLIIFT
jgi:hypothetical protein